MSGLAHRADTFRTLRAEVEASILPLATSVDGRRFTFQAALNGLELRLGGYAMLEGDGERSLAQVRSLAAAVFGLVLGALYLVGGQTVQFSGSEGSVMLLSGEVHYATWALAGIAVVKLAATSWSLTAGYRGGLVFPSVFAGVAVSLLVAGALPDVSGPGVLLGSVAGLLVEMTAPLLGVVMLLALLPGKLLPLGIAGAAGAIAGRVALARLKPVS